MAGALTGLIGGGTIGQATVRLVLDSSQFNAGLTQAQGKLQSIGAGMSKIGGALTRGVTVPLVAAGAVATKMALDFNKAFVQIQTLASSGGHSIAQMKTEVLSLAQATGQDPNGLATALYQVLSAGKAAAQQAFPILTAAAKGAALGMGSVQDIAKILTTTMNAYGPKTISASQAMDVLTQATHDSAAEADALAGSLGPVIGIAAQVGVSFADMTAALATATNNGISAERAATGLRFLLQSLAAPTATAKQKLDQYGISLQDLQRMISQQGLTGTLQTLAKTFDLTSTRGQQAWKAVVGGARGAVVANTLVGKSADAASQEVTKLGNAAGVTQKKFELWGQTITGKNAIALGKLKVAAIQLGQQLIPIFEHVVKAVTDLVDAFSKLPDGVQETVVKVAALAALAGPLLKLSGIIVGLVGKFGQLTGALGGTETAVAGIGTAADGLIGVVPQLIGVAAAIKGIVDEISAFKKGGPLAAVASAVKTLGLFTGNLAANLQAVGDGLTRTQQSLVRAGQGLVKAAGLVQVAMRIIGASMDSVHHAGQAAGNAIANVGKQVEHAAGSMVKAGQLGKMASRGVAAVGNAATGAAGDMVKAAGSADNLTGSLQTVGRQHPHPKITVDTGNAQAAVSSVLGLLQSVDGYVAHAVISVSRVVTGAAAGLGGATGGIFPMAAGGYITHGPVQSGRYTFGEGSYNTFAGKGAEAVIPLNDNTMDRLAKRLNKGGHTINVTINTQGSMDPNQLAASVSRHLARTIREEALV